MRDSFVFYRSFYEACKELDAEDFKAAVMAICAHALDGEEPDIKGVSKAVYVMAKPIIDVNNIRYENGKKGGRPKNQTETKTKPNENQTGTEAEPYVYVYDNEYVSVDNTKRARAKKTGKKIPFNKFEQRTYDYDQLEKRLLGQG